MPAMLRLPGKGKKIAWAILGKPVNMTAKKSAAQIAVDKKMTAEETSRCR